MTPLIQHQSARKLDLPSQSIKRKSAYLRIGIYLEFMLLVAAFPCLANTSGPAVFNFTLSAKPGQVIGIQGDNFGTSPQVWIQVVTATSGTPTPTTQLTNVLTASSQYVAAELPSTTAMGMYAIFVKNTSTGVFSSAKFVNQAWAHQTLDLAGSGIDPSRHFRLAGRNLQFAGVSPTVQFKKVSDGTLTTAAVTPGSDPYILTVTAPSSLVAGQSYDLVISNGYGGAYGTVTVTGTTPRLIPRLVARATGTDHWGLNVPWAADYTFYGNVYNVKTDSRLSLHAAGDGATDDKPAIAAAINQASADGGGVVYLPAGTYVIGSSDVWMAQINKVVLQGDGIGVTTILGTSTTSANNCVFSGRQHDYGMSYVGFVDMTITNSSTGPQYLINVGSTGNDMFVVRCKLVSWGGTLDSSGTNNFLVQDSQFIGRGAISCEFKKDVLMRNNYVEWSNGRMSFYSQDGKFDDRMQFENNLCRRSIYRYSTSIGYGALSLGGTQHLALLNNTFNRLEDTTSTPIPKNNDGETIMDENIQYKVLSTVTGSSDTTLTDSTKSWSTSFTGWQVSIIRGPGAGQTRNIVSSTANTLTVDTPWDVNPTSASNYAVTQFDCDHLIKGNLLQEVPRGIWDCYAGSMNNIEIVGNVCIDTNGIYLRGDTRPVGGPQRFNVQSDVIVEGNTVTNTRNWYPAQIVVTQNAIDGTQVYGNAFYNVVVRDNTLNGLGLSGPGTDDGTGCEEGYYVRQHGIVDSSHAGVSGVIFDHDTANNVPYVYHLNTGSSQTVIWNSVNTSFDLAECDATSSGATHPSVGTVMGPASPYGSDIILDNTDAGVTTTGSWTVSTSGNSHSEGFYGVNYINDGNAGKGTKTVRFTPTIPAAGSYQVYARWIAGTNRSASVPFTVTSASGTTNLNENQQINDSQWVSLGTYTFSAGTSGNVLISNTGTSGYVMVDAVRFVPLGPTQVIMDNADSSGVTITGSWPASTYNTGQYYGINYLTDGNTGKGTKSVRFTPAIPIAGTYQIYMMWNATAGVTDRASNAPVTVTYAGGTANLTENMRANGGTWVLIGTYAFNAGTAGNLLLSNTSSNGYVVADAVKFVLQ